MSDAFHTMAGSADLGWVLGLTTLLFIATFLYWTWWAFRPANREKMDEAGRLPFDGGEP